jgi:anti-sigma regulatory factor (Ser/Thr protein kinase)
VSTADTERFEIARPLDLQLAVLRCQRSTLLQGATDLERSVIATIVSELGSNVLKYAVKGTLEVRRVRQGVVADVEITARDAGPGIADVELALRDHYSSGRTLGLGLPGVRRMADALEILPTEGGGTTVRVRKRLMGVPVAAREAAASRNQPMHVAAAAANWQAAGTVRARSGHGSGGDAVAILEREDRALFAIVDATGHGPGAHAVARGLTDRLRGHFATTSQPDDVTALLRDLHDASVGTVGAAAGLAVLDTGTGALQYLAVGNVRASVLRSDRFTGVSRDGVLGRRWPTPFVQRTTLRDGAVVLMWTDGLPETLARTIVGRGHDTLHVGDAAAIAEAAVARYGKGHDDAACLVARWRP